MGKQGNEKECGQTGHGTEGHIAGKVENDEKNERECQCGGEMEHDEDAHERGDTFSAFEFQVDGEEVSQDDGGTTQYNGHRRIEVAQCVENDHHAFEHIQYQGNKAGFFTLAPHDIGGPDIPASFFADIFSFEEKVYDETEGYGPQQVGADNEPYLML